MRVRHEFRALDRRRPLAPRLLRAPPRRARPTVVGLVERALSFFDAHGIEANSLMSDNASYTHSRASASCSSSGASATS
jgi:hypothetical protein